jgi:plasmid maintenance system killer protein
MRIVFASRRLERCFLDVTLATREWGQQAGLRHIQRITILAAANGLHELTRSRSLRLHPPRGDRRGEWTITLQGRWRLVVEPIDRETVRIKEVSAHYGD